MRVARCPFRLELAGELVAANFLEGFLKLLVEARSEKLHGAEQTAELGRGPCAAAER